MTRRQLLARVSMGFPGLALSSLLGAPPHRAAKAKNVLFLFMPGGVSHMDTFDPKPKLNQVSGQLSGQGKRKWHGSPWSFKQHGQSGLWVSELFPHITEVVDELAVIRSMVSEFPLHARGNVFLHTGRNIGGFPSLGSWITYGLGSENRNLPGYVLLRDEYVPPGGLENFSNGFLPATHQATHLKGDDPPVDNIVPADPGARQQTKLETILAQDSAFAKGRGGDDAVESAIRNYEMAYRMQSLVPDVLDLAKESEATKRLYGLDSDDKYKRLYGLQCLRARRLLESGVRFVEVTSPNIFGMNGTWDQHDKLKQGHETNARVTDQAVTALIKDLRARGLLDETLVLWAGEFGRTPDTANGDGRDHHPACFTIWMAGAGVRKGAIYGSTDDLGNKVAQHPVTIHDLHATMLQQLGLDHRRLTYRFGGRDVSLTDVHGRVVNEVLA